MTADRPTTEPRTYIMGIDPEEDAYLVRQEQERIEADAAQEATPPSLIDAVRIILINDVPSDEAWRDLNEAYDAALAAQRGAVCPHGEPWTERCDHPCHEPGAAPRAEGLLHEVEQAFVPVYGPGESGTRVDLAARFRAWLAGTHCYSCGAETHPGFDHTCPQSEGAAPHEHEWTAGTQPGPYPGLPAATCIAPGHFEGAAPRCAWITSHNQFTMWCSKDAGHDGDHRPTYTSPEGAAPRAEGLPSVEVLAEALHGFLIYDPTRPHSGVRPRANDPHSCWPCWNGADYILARLSRPSDEND